jgi:hypothetical protein
MVHCFQVLQVPPTGLERLIGHAFLAGAPVPARSARSTGAGIPVSGTLAACSTVPFKSSTPAIDMTLWDGRDTAEKN